jgi:hypothetical protein
MPNTKISEQKIAAAENQEQTPFKPEANGTPAVDHEQSPSRPEQLEQVYDQFKLESETESPQAQEGRAGEAVAFTGVGLAGQAQLQRQKMVEKILAENLTDIYTQLPPLRQQEFKAAGERTAREISLLLEQAKIKINKIIGLIKKWLMLIPGVNRFFLEQEAKIKTDKIMAITHQNRI